jgi:predicted molibdopterin-dependent oxidoreductase YjgC
VPVSELRIRGTVDRPVPVTLQVDGAAVTAHPGESVAAALLAAGIRRLGHSGRAGAPRGAFCHMGTCQECLVQVDGVAVQACMTLVRDGMTVELRRI